MILSCVNIGGRKPPTLLPLTAPRRRRFYLILFLFFFHAFSGLVFWSVRSLRLCLAGFDGFLFLFGSQSLSVPVPVFNNNNKKKANQSNRI